LCQEGTMTSLRTAAAAFILLSISIHFVAGQTITATFQGYALDPNGDPLPGAYITLVKTDTGWNKIAESQANGFYQFVLVPPGPYRLSAKMSGFSDVVLQGLNASTNQVVVYDLSFQVAATQESVNVVGEQPLIEKTESDLSTIIPSERVDALPVAERDLLNLAFLSPGALFARRGFGYDQVTEVGVGSQSYSDTLANVDGGSVMSPGGGYPIALVTPLDSVQEYEFLTNRYSAEFGGASGGVVNIITKSGTNNLHGTAFLLLRDDALDAAAPFAEEGQQLPSNRQQFGMTFGGPIEQDRTHFFIAYDAYLSDQTLIVDTANTIPGDGPVPFSRKQHSFLARLDHELTTAHQISARYAYGYYGDRNFSFGPFVAEGARLNTQLPSHSILLADYWSVNDRTNNELRFQFFRVGVKLDSNSDRPLEVRPSSINGSFSSMPQDRTEERIQITDNLSYLLVAKNSSHSFKTGIDFQALPIDQSFNNYGRGSYEFETDEPFDPSNPFTFPVQSIFGGPSSNRRTSITFGFYFSDDWMISNQVTLNLGIRYDIETQPYDDDFQTPVPFLVEPDTDGNNWSPRLGLAYQAGERTVIRTGYGRFYTRAYNMSPGVSNQPLIITINPDYQGFPNPTAGDSFSEVSFSGIDPDFDVPYTDQFSFGADHEFTRNLAVSADYIRTGGKNEILRVEGNPIDAVTGERIFPEFGSIPLFSGVGNSEYDGLQVFLRTRSGGRFSYGLGYTLSRTRNDHNSISDFIENVADLKNEEGLSLNDARHRLTFNGLAELPWNLQVSGTLILTSAQPFYVASGIDENGDGIFNERPPGVERNAGHGEPFKRLDLRISRVFDVRKIQVEGIVEFYNLFNNKNIDPDTINGIVVSPNFGKGGSSANPLYIARQVQLGARLRF